MNECRGENVRHYSVEGKRENLKTLKTFLQNLKILKKIMNLSSWDVKYNLICARYVVGVSQYMKEAKNMKDLKWNVLKREEKIWRDIMSGDSGDRVLWISS